LEENVRFLEANPDYVASTSPNCFEGQDPSGSNLVTFAIDGDPVERMKAFLDNSWKSHGIFYAVFRTDMLKTCGILGRSFLGSDWAVDLYVASLGKINRTKRGLIVFGSSGASTHVNVWKGHRTRAIYWILPFYEVSIYAIRLSSAFSWSQRLPLVWRLLKLNAWSAYSQIHHELYPFYVSCIKRGLGRLFGGASR
jgi:hypothetical protein